MHCNWATLTRNHILERPIPLRWWWINNLPEIYHLDSLKALQWQRSHAGLEWLSYRTYAINYEFRDHGDNLRCLPSFHKKICLVKLRHRVGKPLLRRTTGMRVYINWCDQCPHSRVDPEDDYDQCNDMWGGGVEWDAHYLPSIIFFWTFDSLFSVFTLQLCCVHTAASGMRIAWLAATPQTFQSTEISLSRQWCRMLFGCSYISLH